MKTFLRFCVGLISLTFFSTISVACVDYHPDSVRVNILIDTVDCNMIVQVSNLNMFGGNPNDFCSCGIHNSIPDGATIEWVAFVDSLTQEPLEGFDLFEYSDDSATSWEDADPSTLDWSGFVANVNDAGIVADQAVMLWIVLDVGDMNPEWNFLCENYNEGSLFETFFNWGFGTDEFDDENQILADTHQDITFFSDNSVYMTFEIILHQTYLDIIQTLEDHYNGIEEGQLVEVSIYPNPASETLFIDAGTGKVDSIEMFDLVGKVVFSALGTKSIDVSELPEGIYLLRVVVNGIEQTQRVKVTR